MTSTRTIAPRTSRGALNPWARGRYGNSKCPPFVADAGGRMKVVHRKDAKALKGDKSLSYQVIPPENGCVFPRRFDARNSEPRQGAPSVPFLPRAAVRDRGPVSQLASARSALD